MLQTRFKKTLAFTAAALVVCSISSPALHAQGGDSIKYLSDIDNNTATTNQSLNSTNSFLADIDQNTTSAAPYNANNIWGTLYAILVVLNSWIIKDNSSPTANLQSGLTQITNAITQDQTNQLNIQQQLTTDFFNYGNVDATKLSYINDLAFESLLGQPFVSPDPRKDPNTGEPITTANLAYNYLENVSGLTIAHTLPDNRLWKGSTADKLAYKNYYKTISAVQTFNAYVLSQMYAEYSNGTPLNQAQTSLLSEASGSDWFSTVSAENIGFVLRQLLLFASQTYVLMTQLLKAENQLIESQSMTNTLLILLNQNNEQQMILRASSK